jgi:hypothetical protein
MDTKYTTDSVTTEFTFSEQHDELGSIWLKYYLHAFGDNQKQIDITIYSMNRMHMPGYIFKGSFVDLVGLILKVKYPPVALGNNAEVIEKARELIPDTCPHCERDLDVNIPGIIEALTVSRSADLPGQSDSQTK